MDEHLEMPVNQVFMMRDNDVIEHGFFARSAGEPP